MEAVFNKYDKKTHKQEIKDQKSCMRLIKQLKYLIKHPITHDTFISNIRSVIGTAWRYKSYCCSRDEIKNFIMHHNSTNDTIKFELPQQHHYYVDYIRAFVNLDQKTIIYKFGY